MFRRLDTVRVPDGPELRGGRRYLGVGGTPVASRFPAPSALTFDDLRDLTGVPAAVAVVGGADGLSAASILGDFGKQVTVVKRRPRLVSHADQDILRAGGFVPRNAAWPC